MKLEELIDEWDKNISTAHKEKDKNISLILMLFGAF